MTQTFVAWAVDGERRKALARALEAAGYRVGDPNKSVPGVKVRVRTDTADGAEVEQLVAEHAPGAKKMPSTSPTRMIRGYRDGRP